MLMRLADEYSPIDELNGKASEAATHLLAPRAGMFASDNRLKNVLDG